MAPDKSCPFCEIVTGKENNRIISNSQYAFVVHDIYPISLGHSLIIPNRHVESFFDLEPGERQGMLNLLEQVKSDLDKQFSPDAYNLGINDGPAAGQTVMHCHMHVIPRYHGDQSDPRGGVRWVNPEKAIYWDESK